MNEISYVLVGQRRYRVWCGRLRQRQVGAPSSVEVDWAWILGREERHGDLLGFFHTHPSGLGLPSQRDERIMRVWVSCLGKPLLCLIAAGQTLAAYKYVHDEDCGHRLPIVERLPWNLIIAVDKEVRYARPAVPRNTISRR
jgi:hypothetical protein